MVGKEALKGYILEEILAYLIRNTGYKLIIDSNEDPNDLKMRGNNLIVKGRGAEHQVDVLGQLKWIPAFTYPIRLFVEAKFRGNPTKLPTVRNAVGVVLDINQKYNTVRQNRIPQLRYHYAYSLFSTSGFTKPAQEMAFAHEISLIDLSGPEYNQLKNSIDNVVDNLETLRKQKNFVKAVRYRIRRTLETISHNSTNDYPRYYNAVIDEIIRERLEPLFETVRQYDELFVGMASGPFMILLRAQNPQDFIDYVSVSPKTDVTITWSSEYEEGRVWTIRAADEMDAFQLEFRIPKTIEKYIFGLPRGTRVRALEAKETLLSEITVYRHGENADRLYTLKYNRVATERQLREMNTQEREH